ncbi:MAG: hypothetical protein ABIT70_15595 [Sulfuriferula sp.]|jgi:hypothetical protein
MHTKNALLALTLFICSQATPAFEVGEFKSGMTRDQLKATLKSWNFENKVETGDTLMAYDSSDSPASRRYVFVFCNDKLVGFDQEMTASFNNLITVTGNFNTQYGNPIKVIALHNVVGSGEKNTMAIFWRKVSDIIGVRYILQSNSEQLTTTYQVSNNCWQAPR